MGIITSHILAHFPHQVCPMVAKQAKNIVPRMEIKTIKTIKTTQNNVCTAVPMRRGSGTTGYCCDKPSRITWMNEFHNGPDVLGVLGSWNICRVRLGGTSHCYHTE